MTFTFLPGVGLWTVSKLAPGLPFLRSLHAAVWATFQLALFTDTVIYGIFRYHFNAMVWNVLTTDSGGENIHVGWQEYATVVTCTGVFAAVIFWSYGKLLLTNEKRSSNAESLPRGFRPSWLFRMILMPIALVQLGIYAHADLYRDRRVVALSRLYPIYPSLTIKSLASDHFGVNLEEMPRVDFDAEGVLLNYPISNPIIPATGPRPNILILAIDCLRADMLAPSTMPRVSSWMPKARVFRDHLSGGNATRHGLFSLIYGLHGSYWRSIYGEQRSPVLVDTLLDLGYDFKVLSSPSMSYPEFRSTAWVRIEDDVEDGLGDVVPGYRDNAVADAFSAFLDERDGAAPFFSFAFIDSTHSYDFPTEHAVFEPYEQRIEYMSLAMGMTQEEAQPVFNRYRNSVHYTDDVAGRMLDALAASGELENTLVIVTGDHGEEFFEYGHIGHTSNFAGVQTRVPLLMMGPGIPFGEETRPTSHVDVPATILELMGADPAQRGEWTLGENLLSPLAKRSRVIADWHSVGLWVDGAIICLPMESYGGQTEVYDMQWNLVEDDQKFLKAGSEALLNLALESGRFRR